MHFPIPYEESGSYLTKPPPQHRIMDLPTTEESCTMGIAPCISGALRSRGFWFRFSGVGEVGTRGLGSKGFGFWGFGVGALGFEGCGVLGLGV